MLAVFFSILLLARSLFLPGGSAQFAQPNQSAKILVVSGHRANFAKGCT